MAMESCNSEDLQRDEHGDGKSRIIPSLDAENDSEYSIGIENMGPACVQRDQFFTASADSVCINAADGIASTSEPGRPSASSRIQEMIENKGGFSNEQEFEIHYSKAHWSELQPTKGECSKTLRDAKYLRERNLKSFYALERSVARTGRDGFFQDFFDLRRWFPTLGKKIAQGGQGEIFEAEFDSVVKLFDLKVSPEDVMTSGLIDHIGQRDYFASYSGIGRHLVRAGLVGNENSEVNGRFYIVMRRLWGDLRKLIDQRMMGSNNQGPPFTTKQVLWLMHAIAYDMWCLHKISILHRDLKASNVLVEGKECPSLDVRGNYRVIVADYESSDGVVGTGFWRAPEILQQLKVRKPGIVLKYTKECDVYSFGMTCYELVTGCIPFEGYPQSNYDLVLSGTRPELPADVDPLVKGIMTSCWHSDPSQRPNFLDICCRVASSQVGRHMSGAKHGHDRTLVEGTWRTSALHDTDASQMMPSFVGMCNRFVNLHVGRFVVGAKLWPKRFLDKSGVMIPKYWGDLRMLIDKLNYRWDGKVDCYLESGSGSKPPVFNTKQALRLMLAIARAMCNLHKEEPPIILGDLEASNVLVYGNRSCPSLDEDGNYMVTVVDYKCVTGNLRMWPSYFGNRLAPEIIQQIYNPKNGNFWDSNVDVVVTKECDVYGYGMLCYEFVMWRIPFDEGFEDFGSQAEMASWAPICQWDLKKKILNGRRPKVAADLDPLIEAIITSCWNHDPSQRSTFLDICNRIANSPGFQPSSLH